MILWPSEGSGCLIWEPLISEEAAQFEKKALKIFANCAKDRKFHSLDIWIFFSRKLDAEDSDLNKMLLQENICFAIWLCGL